jgi:predicted PurR-regulated permease PerM
MYGMPVTVKRSIELLGLVLLGTILVIGKNIIMPLLMSFFFSIMLLPFYRFFRKTRIPEIISIFLPILFLSIFLFFVGWLFSNQLGFLMKDFSSIQNNVTRHLDTLSVWVSHAFGFSPTDQLKFINEQSNNLFRSVGSILGRTAGSISGILVFFGLLPIYIYLIMMYRRRLLKFILLWYAAEEHIKLMEVIQRIESMVKSYIVGLLIQISYIIILLGGTLVLFGIKHALLIGIIFSFLNLIPYLGALIGNILGVIITLASSEKFTDVLIVLGAITLVQLLDNNILMPRIVGSKVKINALASIVGIIIAGSMTGISGMFLAMPIIAIAKIVFDHSDQYKKWGVLLGDNEEI